MLFWLNEASERLNSHIYTWHTYSDLLPLTFSNALLKLFCGKSLDEKLFASVDSCVFCCVGGNDDACWTSSCFFDVLMRELNGILSVIFSSKMTCSLTSVWPRYSLTIMGTASPGCKDGKLGIWMFRLSTWSRRASKAESILVLASLVLSKAAYTNVSNGMSCENSTTYIWMYCADRQHSISFQCIRGSS